MAASSKKLIEVYIDLLNLLECPVCLKYASSKEGPIKICTQGHFICGECGQKIVSCPTCRGQFTNVRPTILEQIIEALAYPCGKVGCGTMSAIKDICNHELQCSYEENINCNKNMIQSQNILKHIEEQYSSFSLNAGNDITELGLCINCINFGLSLEEDDSRSRNGSDNNQRTNRNLTKTQEPRNIDARRSNVLQSRGESSGKRSKRPPRGPNSRRSPRGSKTSPKHTSSYLLFLILLSLL